MQFFNSTAKHSTNHQRSGMMFQRLNYNFYYSELQIINLNSEHLFLHSSSIVKNKLTSQTNNQNLKLHAQI